MKLKSSPVVPRGNLRDSHRCSKNTHLRTFSVAVALLLTATFSLTAGPARAATITLGPSADAVVKSATPGTNYGTATGLKADNSPVEMSFLKFVVTGTGGTVTAAKLRLFVADPSPVGGQFRHVPDNSWAEGSVTWSNAPAASSTNIASLGAVSTGSWVEVDVFSLVKADGTYSLRISSTNSDGAIYNSKEFSDATRRPQLVLTTGSTPPPPPPPPPGPNPCGTAAAPPATYDHVVWIIFENKRYSQVIGSPSAPYMTQTAQKCASLTNWSDAGSQFPSLPSYLAMTSGSTQGVSTDNSPGSLPPITADNLFRQVRARGLTQKSYQEDMPSNCRLTNSGLYAVRHNPEVYYQGTGDRAACATNNVSLGTTTSGNLFNDLTNNTLPSFSLITPNVCNDTHDCSITTGDTWLSRWLPVILGSQSYQAGRTAVVVLYDEDTPVPNFVVAPSVIPGTVVTGAYSHYSLLRATEEMLGITNLLLNAGTAPSLRQPLNL
jgi:hypothetical protein